MKKLIVLAALVGLSGCAGFHLEPLSAGEMEAFQRDNEDRQRQQMENLQLQMEQQRESLILFNEQNRNAACENWGSCY